MIPALGLLANRKLWLVIGVAVLVVGVVVYVAILRGQVAEARADLAELQAEATHLEARITQRDTAINIMTADRERLSQVVHGLRGQASELQVALDRCSMARAQAQLIFTQAQEVPRVEIKAPGGVIDQDSSAAAIDLLNRVLGGVSDHAPGAP